MLAVPITTQISQQTFGAVGDGIADDTTALQNMLDQLAAGAMVILAPGVYKVTSQLTVNFPTTALGNNWFGISGYGARIQSAIVPRTANTSAATTSGQVLTFASVPAGVKIGDTVYDVTNPSALINGSWVIAATATTVTVDYAVQGSGVALGDTINFCPPVLTFSSETTIRYMLIEGLKIAGSGSAQWGKAEGSGIYMAAPSGTEYLYDMCLREVAVEGCGGNGFHFVNDVFESDLFACYGQDCGGSGAVWENNSNVGSGVISAFKVYGGSWAQNGANGFAFRGSGSSGAPYDILLAGAYIRNNQRWGVWASNHVLMCRDCGFENNWGSAGSFAAGLPAVDFQVEATFDSCTATSNQYQTGMAQGFLQGARALTFRNCEIDAEGSGNPMFLGKTTGGSGGAIVLDDHTSENLRGIATGCFGMLFSGGEQFRMQSSLDTGSIAASGTWSSATASWYQTADRICELTLMDKAGTAVNGHWIIYGLNTIQAVGTPAGCSLAFGTAGTYGTPLILTNTGAGAIDFVGNLRALR